MVLTAAFEFDPRSNKEATIRPTDNIEVPQVSVVATQCLIVLLYQVREEAIHPPSFLQLIRELGNINVKKKEPPFCYPYSMKARVLVLSHLARMDVPEELEEGRTLNNKFTLHVREACLFHPNIKCKLAVWKQHFKATVFPVYSSPQR